MMSLKNITPLLTGLKGGHMNNYAITHHSYNNYSISDGKASYCHLTWAACAALYVWLIKGEMK